jgi:hypothetical protein
MDIYGYLMDIYWIFNGYLSIFNGYLLDIQWIFVGYSMDIYLSLMDI